MVRRERARAGSMVSGGACAKRRVTVAVAAAAATRTRYTHHHHHLAPLLPAVFLLAAATIPTEGKKPVVVCSSIFLLSPSPLSRAFVKILSAATFHARRVVSAPPMTKDRDGRSATGPPALARCLIIIIVVVTRSPAAGHSRVPNLRRCPRLPDVRSRIFQISYAVPDNDCEHLITIFRSGHFYNNYNNTVCLRMTRERRLTSSITMRSRINNI